ncbi:hypothetical protein D3C77_633440 [compost metagenome]
MAGHAAGEPGGHGFGQRQLLDHVACIGYEGLALHGEADVAAAALEQAEPQLGFQRRDLPGQRGLGQVKGLGGAAEMQGLGHGQEIAQFAEVEHGAP